MRRGLCSEKVALADWRESNLTYNTTIRVERMVGVQEDVLVFGRCISDAHCIAPWPAHFLEFSCQRRGDDDGGGKGFGLRVTE